jgi:hypothetical protein
MSDDGRFTGLVGDFGFGLTNPVSGWCWVDLSGGGRFVAGDDDVFDAAVAVRAVLTSFFAAG